MARTAAWIDWRPDRDAAIKKALEVIEAAAEAAAAESADYVSGFMTKAAPVATGETQSGLSSEDVSAGGLFAHEVAERDPDRVDVAFFLNQGTKHMDARPFATDAVTSERRRLTRRVRRHVKSRLSGDK